MDPLALFDAALNALNAEDWRGAAQLCDPVSLRAFKRQLLERFTPDRPPRELTIEDLLRHTPDKPRQVAEYELAQHRRRADPRRRVGGPPQGRGKARRLLRPARPPVGV